MKVPVFLVRMDDEGKLNPEPVDMSGLFSIQIELKSGRIEIMCSDGHWLDVHTINGRLVVQPEATNHIVLRPV